MPDTPERLLTGREVASITGLTPRQVMRLYREREIPGFVLSERVVRFRASEVEAWIQSKRIA